MAGGFTSSDPNLTNPTNNALEEITVTAKKWSVTQRTIPRENVLNSYRSYTYNFTLACLPKAVYNSNSYRGVNGLPAESIILKSGGKGDSKFNAPGPSAEQLIDNQWTQSFTSAANQLDTGLVDSNRAISSQKEIDFLTDSKAAVEDFNKFSAGVFDMYIDNVQITTAMSYTAQSNTTLFTKLSFDVFEPFSIQGFVEAMHAAALANGYKNYTHAVFLLKMEFKGYPDDQLVPDPENVPKATRFFPFHFKSLDVELTENGTRYKCVCLPYSEIGFGLASQLKNSIQCSGSTVNTLLQDFIDKFSKQVTTDDNASKNPEAANKSDEYKLVIEDKDIASATFGELLRGAKIYKFEDPGTSASATGYRLEKVDKPTPEQQAAAPEANKDIKDQPVSVVVNGQRIIEFISAVIRDSSYLQSILKDVEKAKDKNGNIKFWVVNLKTEILEYDEVAGRDRRRYTYEVKPRLLPANSLPGYQDIAIPEPILVRNYSYIYSGKNTDVLNFQAKFDNLFVQSLPKALGNNSAVPAKDGAAPSNSTDKVLEKNKITGNTSVTAVPITKQFTNYATEVHVGNQINAQAPQSTQLSIEARNAFHTLIENSQASFLMADMEIIGDPFYLVTKGGNYKPENIEPGITEDNEADHFQGPVYVGLLFRAARDILPLSSGGGMQFNKDTVYSGVFQIFTVDSTFQNGVFKQRLSLKKILTPAENIKLPGFSDVYKTIPDANDQTVADSAKDQVPLDQRANSLKDAINDVKNAINSVKAAKAQIVASINGAIEGVADAVQQAVSPVVSTLNNINSKVQGVQANAADAVSRLGLSGVQVSNLTPQSVARLLTAVKHIPDGVNVAQMQAQGVVVNLKKIQDLPATASYKLARTATAANGNSVVKSIDPGSQNA